MARRIEKHFAIELRKEGKTYSEIINKLKVPKGTLSGWLSGYPLTKTQLSNLEKRVREKKLLAVEKTTAIKFGKWQKRLTETYLRERRELLPLTKKELYLCGLFLYCGEGAKSIKGSLSLNNTDPKVMKFYYYWLTDVFGVPKSKIKVALHLYKDMNTENTINFWSKELCIPKTQFIKPYIKQSFRRDIKQKGFGYGTCGLFVYDRLIKERIIQGISAIADFYGKKMGGLV